MRPGTEPGSTDPRSPNNGGYRRVQTERARLDALPTPLLALAATPYVALSGTANVVMQLSWPGIGYGVKDSTVEGARLFDDPRRRQRTTIGYLAVATHGTAEERAAFRAATNLSHASVRSAPGVAPAYSAFDPALQRWVGACLYRGFEDAFEAVYGPLGRRAEAFYREGVVLGGMLQMPASAWPESRAAFEDYWRAGIEAASIDDAVRDYLMRVVRLEYLDRRVPERVVRLRTWLVSGFLPPTLREQMRLPWTESDQARFERVTRRTAGAIRRLPDRARHYPFTSVLADVRRRLAAGERLF